MKNKIIISTDYYYYWTYCMWRKEGLNYKAEEDRDREEEQVLDDEGNPIPNAPPKPP